MPFEEPRTSTPCSGPAILPARAPPPASLLKPAVRPRESPSSGGVDPLGEEKDRARSRGKADVNTSGDATRAAIAAAMVPASESSTPTELTWKTSVCAVIESTFACPGQPRNRRGADQRVRAPRVSPPRRYQVFVRAPCLGNASHARARRPRRSRRLRRSGGSGRARRPRGDPHRARRAGGGGRRRAGVGRRLAPVAPNERPLSPRARARARRRR